MVRTSEPAPLKALSWSVTFARRPWFLVLFFGLLVFASRYPLAPGQLFTFDDVNLAYSIGHFDIRNSQPQPPGYPLFVMEMRVLSWLRFRRPESILLALSLAGSVAVLVLMALFGNRFFGADSGFWAACLLVFNPVFWHTGLASALRIQLGLLSLAVAAACWRAWRGDGRWVFISALVLGLGSGVRPEAGPVLFPLWAACALRAPVSWRDRARALGVMAAGVLAWLLPAMIASGGPFAYIRTSLDYLSDQASVSSGLFGATELKWQTTFWRLVVWTFCCLLGCPLPAVLAWHRREGWAAGRDRLAFLGLWFAPPFLFACFVHVEDPGQTLGLGVVVALGGGYLFSRALDSTQQAISRWQGLTLAVASLAVAWITEHQDAPVMVAAVPLAALGAGLLLKISRTKNLGYPPRWMAMPFLLAPALIVNFTIFQNPGWYHQGTGAGDQVLADLDSGLALTSYQHIRNTLAIDDHSLRQIIRLAAERRGQTVVVWEHGLAPWRKAAYYAGGVPVVVLEHRLIRAGSPPVAAVWEGPRLERRLQGPAPLHFDLPPARRIVWMLNPRTDFYQLAARSFALTPAGPVWYTDLAAAHGSALLGEYTLAW